MDKRILICADLDRTLLPNGREAESPGARERFSKFVSRKEIALVYVTGRHQALVAEAIDRYALPLPDYVIGDVGTTLYPLSSKNRSQKNWVPWVPWEQEIAPDWGSHTHDSLKRLLEDLPDWRLQENAKQNRFKLSYYVSINADRADRPKLIEIVRKRLSACGVKASVIWSVDASAGLGLLDILPARATKYHAIDFLMKHWGFSIEKTIFSGDSGNDLEVLASPIRAVLVANSTAEVQEQARQSAQKNDTSNALYFAKGGFMGMNGHYSAGVLEGIAHYLPETREWMKL